MFIKLTKFIQSCVLVEDEQYTAIFDPDSFTWGSKSFPLDSLSKLDYILITHGHFDHLSVDFVKALLEKFPEAKIFAAGEVADELKKAGLTNVTTESEGVITVANAPHENMTPISGQPNNENVAITFDNKVTHPGDSFQINQSAPVLLLPIDGPWGSTAQAIELLSKVKPKYVLPIHDAMYTDQWRSMSYDWVEGACKQNGATFLRPEPGKAVEADV